MRALVLGGTGFIGSHLVDRLLARGHKVRVFSRAPERFRDPLSGVDYRQAGFDDIPALAEAISGVDVVYHLISTTVPATSNRDPVFDIESNLAATVRLLKLLSESEVKKLVYLSSGGTVYGIPDSVPIPESHRLAPICSYGIVKVAVENYLRMFHRSHGLDYVIIRPSNPYGPRQGHFGVQGVIGTFLGRIAGGEELEVWGDGSLVRDFVYITDLADLCVSAGEGDGTGVYNGGSGTGCSIAEVIGIMEKVIGRRLEVQYRPGRGFDVPRVILDIAAARRDFAWAPKIGIEEGIRRTWEEMAGGGNK